MKLHFHGAVRTTTGSMHVVEAAGKKILLDCGLFQGKRKEAFERNRHLPFDPKTFDAGILSHAHIDHSGNLPTLAKKGWGAPIYTTPATADLCDVLLEDSARLQEQDVKFVNKWRAERGKNLFEPLYTPDDARKILGCFHPVPYGETRELFPGIRLAFFDAGHILGSAFTVLDIEEGGKKTRLMFTGDVGRKGMPILQDPSTVPGVEVLITESTYGDRLHAKEGDVSRKLAELCAEVYQRKSKLLIPAFSVGRTQQLLYFLHQLCDRKAIPPIPVYLDSPLAAKATQIHDRHPECFDRETLEFLRTGDTPFTFPNLRYTADARESQRLNAAPGPMVVISASGMCEGGRIQHHLAHNIAHPANIVLIVGFQAEHTLGRRIVERDRSVRIFGAEVDLNARVEQIEALSGHADQAELLECIRGFGAAIRQVFVVHGEEARSETLAGLLRKQGPERVTVPRVGESFTL